MKLSWEGEAEDAAAAARAGSELETLRAQAEGEPLVVGNEFAEVRVAKVQTRNGVRLLVESPKSGQWITLDPLELEALTWQNVATFSAMVGNPFAPLFPEGPA
ncbi:hypothetical protein GON03_05755 [Nocardioides sp. MAH-18]|uniref:Dihydrodiol dehydrogenase n=1 Tax=Nocardioides agri TaxID=2682843 RepID=A0A6L6XN47_9ACTN|nr:hypothetical protein [Nocardioides sp. CGMCC 1.13656]MBA2953814.1 hypothetical protein [Nocardioides sp. CGMCC 1.13656]MVQ48679.1 hypothetical protein [Nocardioides sp. MAH-18]